METYLFGTSDACDVVVNRATVSEKHCRLIVDGQKMLLEDLGSKYGTFVNGKQIHSIQAIQRTDEVLLGRIPLPWPNNLPTSRTLPSWLPWAVTGATAALLLLVLLVRPGTSQVADNPPPNPVPVDPNLSNELEDAFELGATDDEISEGLRNWLNENNDKENEDKELDKEEEEEEKKVGESSSTTNVFVTWNNDDPPISTGGTPVSIHIDNPSFDNPSIDYTSIGPGQSSGIPGSIIQPSPLIPGDLPIVPGQLEMLFVATELVGGRLWTDNDPAMGRFAAFGIRLSESASQPVTVQLNADPGLEIANSSFTFQANTPATAAFPVQVRGNGQLGDADFENETSIQRQVRVEISAPELLPVDETAIDIQVLRNTEQDVVLLPISPFNSAEGDSEELETTQGGTCRFRVVKTRPTDPIDVRLNIPEASVANFGPDGATLPIGEIAPQGREVTVQGVRPGRFTIDVSGTVKRNEALTGRIRSGNASLPVNSPLRYTFSASTVDDRVELIGRRYQSPISVPTSLGLLSLFCPAAVVTSESSTNKTKFILIKRVPLKLKNESSSQKRNSNPVPKPIDSAEKLADNTRASSERFVIFKKVPLSFPKDPINESQQELVAVPDCESKSLKEANGLLSNLKLVAEVPNTLALPDDQVVGQSPSPGTMVPVGSKVRLAPVVGIVPDLVGKTLATAKEIVQNEKYRSVSSRQLKDDFDVTDQLPVAGSPLQRGQTVKIMCLVKVPNLVHTSAREADERLKNLKLVSLFPTKVFASDTVLEQSPAAGKKVEVGTKVKLIPGVRVPNVVGMTTPQADQELRNVAIKGQIGVRKTLQVQSNPVPPTTILAQSIAPGTLIPRTKSLGLSIQRYEYVPPRPNPPVVFTQPPTPYPMPPNPPVRDSCGTPFPLETKGAGHKQGGGAQM